MDREKNVTKNWINYTLNDLSEKELFLILQTREYEKDSRKFTNYFFGSMLLSFVLIITLMPRFHNLYIGLTAFIPLAALFFLNSRRNQRVRKVVEKTVNQVKEEKTSGWVGS